MICVSVFSYADEGTRIDDFWVGVFMRVCAPVHACVPKLFITDLETCLQGTQGRVQEAAATYFPWRASEHLSPRSTKKWSD